jgi:hypothetical protein
VCGTAAVPSRKLNSLHVSARCGTRVRTFPPWTVIFWRGPQPRKPPAPDRNRLIRLPDERGLGVRLRMNRHRANAQPPAGTDHPRCRRWFPRSDPGALQRARWRLALRQLPCRRRSWRPGSLRIYRSACVQQTECRRRATESPYFSLGFDKQRFRCDDSGRSFERHARLGSVKYQRTS